MYCLTSINSGLNVTAFVQSSPVIQYKGFFVTLNLLECWLGQLHRHEKVASALMRPSSDHATCCWRVKPARNVSLIVLRTVYTFCSMTVQVVEQVELADAGSVSLYHFSRNLSFYRIAPALLSSGNASFDN